MKRCWNVTWLFLPIVFAACFKFENWIQYAPVGGSTSSLTPKPESAVEIYIDPEKPAKPYKVVALIKLFLQQGGEGGLANGVKLLRSRAASEGIDGVIVICGDPGTVGQEQCSGKGFVYTP
jgi:hypothetical protein